VCNPLDDGHGPERVTWTEIAAFVLAALAWLIVMLFVAGD